MEKAHILIADMPDGANIVYTTTPGVVLQYVSHPYGFTGEVNRAWIEACKIVGRPYTERERKAGWPTAMEPHRLAALQAPQDSTGQAYIHTALQGSCERGEIPCEVFERHDYWVQRNGESKLGEVWTDYAITAPTFSAWLTRQREEPSEHVLAWFRANGVKHPVFASTAKTTTPQQPAPEADTSPAAAPAALKAEDAKDFETLVRYRLQFKDLPAQQRPEWNAEHVAFIGAAVSARGRGGRASVARDLGIHAKTLGDLLKRYPEPEAREANAFTSVVKHCNSA